MIPLIPLLLGGTVLGIAGAIIVSCIINSQIIKEETQASYPDAFKLLIKEKKKNAVNVGIFDKRNNHLGDEEIQSTEGVSKQIHKGQYIYV